MGIQIVRFPVRSLLGCMVRSSGSSLSIMGTSRHISNLTRVCWSPDNKQSKGSTSDSKTVTDESNSTTEIPEVILKEVPDAKLHWEYQQPNDNAQVFDRKPVKVKCMEGKIYMWCACGHSHRQPFCDGTHRLPHLTVGYGKRPPKLKPEWFRPERRKIN